MADYWLGMEQDPESCERIRKSIELIDAKDGMTVLDVGCYKQVAKRFLPTGCQYFGMDISDFVPDTIKKDIDGGFFLDYWEGKNPMRFDRIICLEVLEHLKYPEGTLKSIHRALKEDGIAVISLPNESNLFSRIRALLGTSDQECFGESGKHLHLPSLGQCREFLGRYFEIQEERYYLAFQKSRAAQIAKMLELLPKCLWIFLANKCPSLFARGFIFRLKKK